MTPRARSLTPTPIPVPTPTRTNTNTVANANANASANVNANVNAHAQSRCSSPHTLPDSLPAEAPSAEAGIHKHPVPGSPISPERKRVRDSNPGF
ncbi:hypothetical protein ACJZ2D_009995 [Fusarium nematophilum]